MSAGERRRVLIARALITTPQALVLDEPTAGLDPVARYRFMESIRRLAQEGTTLIIVTHHIDEIIPRSDAWCFCGKARRVRWTNRAGADLRAARERFRRSSRRRSQSRLLPRTPG
jgi:iron complex transport system ATP-binding protein